MEERINEAYTEDGKSLIFLIQEWVTENVSNLYCTKKEKEIKYQCR